MTELPIHDRQGNIVETIQFDEEAAFGKFVNMKLLHQAIVMYEANRRLGTHSTKNRRSITGSSRKIFKQKGTGRARMGMRRRVGSRGGPVAHGPHPRDHSKTMTKRMRRLAVQSAFLGKLRDQEIIVIDELTQDQPKTSAAATILKNLKVPANSLVVSERNTGGAEVDEAGQKAWDNLWKSFRNLPEVGLSSLADLNAYTILDCKNILITRAALDALATGGR